MRNTDSAERVRRFLRAQRKQRGWSQTDLAERANVARNTVAALERGMALREGNEGAIEEALGLRLGTIEDVRRGRLPAEVESGEPQASEPRQLPRPEDYPDRLEYYAASLRYLTQQMRWSEESVLAGYEAASKVNLARKIAERDEQSTQGDELG